jgi:hypothetical protein
VPGPPLAGAGAFVLSSLFFLKGEDWQAVAYGLAVIGAGVLLAEVWGRREAWTPRHTVAVAGGALLTYAWGGFLLSALLGRTDPVTLAGNALFACGAIVLLIAATRRVRVWHETVANRPQADLGPR